MVLGLKPMRKLITFDKYLSVRQNQVLHGPLTQIYGKLITCDNYLGVRQNQGLFLLSIK